MQHPHKLSTSVHVWRSFLLGLSVRNFCFQSFVRVLGEANENIKIARFGWAAECHHDYLRSAYKVRHFVSHILQTLPSSHISRSCTHVLTQ